MCVFTNNLKGMFRKFGKAMCEKKSPVTHDRYIAEKALIIIFSNICCYFKGMHQVNDIILNCDIMMFYFLI